MRDSHPGARACSYTTWTDADDQRGPDWAVEAWRAQQLERRSGVWPCQADQPSAMRQLTQRVETGVAAHCPMPPRPASGGSHIGGRCPQTAQLTAHIAPTNFHLMTAKERAAAAHIRMECTNGRRELTNAG